MYITIREKDETYQNVWRVGEAYFLEKEPNNIYDDEAIKVKTKKGFHLGWVANSVSTVARGTHSAGYIYRDVQDGTQVIVRFVCADCIIAEIPE